MMYRQKANIVIIILIAVMVGLLAGGSLLQAQMVAGTVMAKQSGTWTVQHGNTANTTAWLVTGTGGTFPVSGTLTGVTTVATVTNLSQMGGVAISMNSGVRDTGTQRVTIATNDVVPVVAGALTSITTGQQAVTASAVVLPTVTAKRVCLKILIAGTQVAYFGPAGVAVATGQELSPGDAWCGGLDNLNRVYVIAAATGSTIAWAVEN